MRLMMLVVLSLLLAASAAAQQAVRVKIDGGTPQYQFDIPAPFAKRWDGHMHTATKIAAVTPPAHPATKSGT